MKKIVILEELRSLLIRQKTLLDRSEITLLTAMSNEEVLRMHQSEKADLVITRPDLPGMSGENLCSRIREDKALRNVSVIMICPDTEAGREQGAKCRANEVLLLPVKPALLLEKARQLLTIPWRKSFRVLLNVKVESSGQDRSFYCRSEDISISGLLIETDRNLAKGDQVSCSFTLPGAGEVKAAGEVVRVIKPPLDSNLHRYGIKFREISGEAKGAIESFADTNAPFSV